jgi:hypothetical protein
VTALHSWNDTATTQAIVEFAETAARPLPPVELATPTATRVVVLDLAGNDELDVQALRHARRARRRARRPRVELRLAAVRAHALELLRRAGLAERVRIEPTLDAALP